MSRQDKTGKNNMKKVIYICFLCLMAITNQALSQNGYVDIGLPSGTKWKTSNAPGLYTYNEAISQFGRKIPTKEQWDELVAECEWTWNGSGFKVTGPNNKSIVLPAEGWSRCDGNKTADYAPGIEGAYWSSTSNGMKEAWMFDLNEDRVEMSSTERCFIGSVRLVLDD